MMSKLIKDVTVQTAGFSTYRTSREQDVALRVDFNATSFNIQRTITMYEEHVHKRILLEMLARDIADGVYQQIMNALEDKSVRIQSAHIKPNMEVFFK